MIRTLVVDDDFRNVFDFATAFGSDYRVTLKPA